MRRSERKYDNPEMPPVRIGVSLRNVPNLPEDFGARWRGAWRRQRCVILANGPSLPETDDLARIDCPVVGINRSFLRHESDVHVVTDKLHVGSYGKLLRRLVPDALRLTRYEAKGCLTPLALNDEEVEALGCGLLPDIADEGWMRVGAGMGALQIAVWLGAKEIIFCGLDLRLPLEHFYDDAPTWLVEHVLNSGEESLRRQVEWLGRVKPELDERGVRVINTTLDAGEDVLEKVAFDELWRRK